jgi:signal transduction histidine kinase
MRIPDNATLAERLTERQIESLAPYGVERRLAPGEYIFDETTIVDSFWVLLEGEVRISRLDGAQETHVTTLQRGDFTGSLVVMAGKTSIFRAQATAPSRVLEIDARSFRRVNAELPEVADIFISTLGRRMRYTQRTRRQQEKMAALGKLSAGLAHELNNPAAAAQRASTGLRSAILRTQLLALEHDRRFSPEQKETLANLQREVAASEGDLALDPIARSDREEELAYWLESRGHEAAWELAPTLAAAGLETGRVERLAEELEDEEALAAALEWLGATCELAELAEEVQQSAARISELVGAMKDHTNMDRGSYAATDVREGLESTLTILGHKLRGATVTRDYEERLPRIWAHAGDLNQVWANLLDNAAAAVGGAGKVGIRAYGHGDSLVVEVSDDGPGIPREAQARIFEPFFTTKQVGEGTGLGLDIVRRIVASHGGEVTFESEPGETRFVVRLPLEREADDGG